MLKRRLLMGLILLVTAGAALQMDSGRALAGQPGQPTDWNRFYYYPYVYYPHSFQKPRSFNHMYHRYPPNRRIPVYNKTWQNFYPSARPYHSGHHFILDIF